MSSPQTSDASPASDAALSRPPPLDHAAFGNGRVLALVSPTLKLSEVNEFADTLLAQRISTTPGVAQVSIFGSQKFAVRAQLDPRELATRGLGLDEVVNAIQQGNVNLPTGTLHGPTQATTVQSTGQLMDAAAFRELIVTYRNGAPVRLRQLGRVISLNAALRIVNTKIHGRVIDVDLMMRRGKPQYHVKVRRTDGVIRTVRLDARTGKVIGWLGF